jgi:hypothetical protein
LPIGDGALACRRFAADAGTTHDRVNDKPGKRVRGAIHVQNVDGGTAAPRPGWCVSKASRAACSTIRTGNGCSMRSA